MPPKRGAAWVAALLIAAGSVLPTDAGAQEDGPVLHEYLAADADDDINQGSTAPGSELPAAIKTPSGTITPPDVRTTPEPQRVYEPSGPAPGFRPDRDTRRPQVEHYDDPFTPTLTPFKRMFAYDSVREDYSLYVRDPQHRQVPVAGSPEDDDDRFFGDMSVDLRAGQYVRIPSIGPDARLIKLVTSPKTEVGVWRDGADNWFLLAQETSQVRIVTELAIDREVFASEFADVGWAELPRVPPQPAAHQAAFQDVVREIGISKSMRPREVVTQMVAYFRSFAPSEETPPGESGGDIYRDLALGKKGVCRHRAFAFLVTALNMGIPARLVHNEAHAWVEVHDDRTWHRIDLGGAAQDLAEDPNLDRPPHAPPPDQFPWPTGRDSGADLDHKNRAEAMQRQSIDDDPNAPRRPGVDPDATAQPGRSDLPETQLTIDDVDHDIFRGKAVGLRGTARSEGQPCAHLRVDVFLLVDGDAADRRLGSLSTDERGVFSGAVVVPADMPIGDHELVVATAGGARCGIGQAR
jgi:transglutaminase-like putative cysteine protease